jgi:hypothetical protein
MLQLFTNKSRESVTELTWDELADRLPELRQLLWRARSAGASCRSRADVDRVFSPLRNEIADLVGLLGANRHHPVLGSVEAYEVASRKVHDAVTCLLRKERP